MSSLEYIAFSFIYTRIRVFVSFGGIKAAFAKWIIIVVPLFVYIVLCTGRVSIVSPRPLYLAKFVTESRVSLVGYLPTVSSVADFLATFRTAILQF